MKLDNQKIIKLENFLSKIQGDTYPEPLSEPHISITRKMLNGLLDKYHFPPGSKILDVGCGQGVALELFLSKGYHPIGIALNDEDIAVCKQKGFQASKMDQSFLEFPDKEFDLVWCRHCLEHSIFPYFTLCELYRVVKQKGFLYVEVPAPDTSCRHQTNQNHYSVLGKSMWAELIKRTGFTLLETLDISFEVPAGPDTYWAFFQQK